MPISSGDPIPRIIWEDEVAPHDYDAAHDYLSLRLNHHRASALIARMQRGYVTHRRANDILRACDREPLAWNDPGMARTRAEVMAGKHLSPILVASFNFGGDIADGYHRVSLAYAIDPFSTVPLRIGSDHN